MFFEDIAVWVTHFYLLVYVQYALSILLFSNSKHL